MKCSLTVAVATLLVAVPALAQDKSKDSGKVSGTFTTETRLRTRGAQSQAGMLLYLEPKSADAKKALGDGKGKVAQVTQKKLQFIPRLLPVQKGTKVVFLNEDRVTHNVFLQHECCKLDSDMEKGQMKEQVFAKAGTYSVVCRLHPEMSMTVVALDTPYFTTCKWKKQKGKNDNGKKFYLAAFEISGVPPGEYTLRSWNKRLSAVAVDVTVTAGKVAKLKQSMK